jgi:hypothetical protein
MDVRTKLKIEQSPDKIDLKSSIVTIGSCFAQNMHTALSNDKFNVYHNPFGTLYNPVSISQLLNATLNNLKLDKSLFISRDAMSVHYHYHSDFKASSVTGLQNRYEQYNNALRSQLVNGNVLIITLGTASIFRHTTYDCIVTNCHKQASSLFERNMLSIHQIKEALTACLTSLFNLNSTVKVILTVSPVRHVRDNLITNSLSKARLITACHYMASEIDRIDYFPSYEIMVDDLRDYRYYQKDLIHPNEIALEYIYDLFQQRYFDAHLSQTLLEIRKIRSGLKHKPFNPNSEQYHKFLADLLDKCEQYEQTIELDYSEEKAELQRRLRDLNA